MKRITVLLFTLILLLMSVTIIASAAEVTGTCGDDLTWHLDESTGMLTISGTGNMTSSPWRYGYSVKTVIIEDGVTSICKSAFSSCSYLTDITIPESVTSIGSAAFEDCNSLRRVTIPESVTKINSSTFWYCVALEEITIPGSVTYIGNDAFEYCKNLKSIVLPDSITGMGDCVFSGCKNLSTVTLPAFITELGEDLFKNCSSLVSVTIPDSVTSIGDGAFESCSSLTNITLPAFITKLGGALFKNCSSLVSVTIPDSVTSIGNGAFESCSSLMNITLPVNVKSIGSYAFENCGQLTDVYYGGTSGQKNKISVSSGNAPLTNATWHCIQAAAPDAPVLKVSVNTTTGKPKLSWNKVEGAGKYRLYRATSKTGKYTLVKTTITSSSYTDTTAKAGKNYYYKVRALDTETETYSEYSNVVNRVCDLAKPVVSITRKNGDPKITWKKISGAEKYRVYRATSKNGTYKYVKTTIKTTSYTDTSVKAGKTYYYKVRAIHSNSSANSAYSAIKHIKAK